MEFLFPHNLQLLEPLGNWIIASDTEWIDNWDWFLPGTSEFLYFRLNSRTWHWFLRQPHTHQGYHEGNAAGTSDKGSEQGYSLFSEWTHTPLELQSSIHRSTTGR
jgi:hypothetical protein